MARNDAVFRALAPRIMRDLLRDVPEWGPLDAAAALGNAGCESAGLTKLQEIRPTVRGSRGGWGWFQWTGPRRRAFEAWAKKRGLANDSYDANYGYLLVELRGSEKATVPAVKAAVGLDAKTVAFEQAFERAGVKNYPSRKRWAAIALAAYNARGARPAAAPARPAGPDAGQIRMVQARLRELGYTEVGTADGKIGPFTRAAIRAYRADRSLPAGDGVDDTLILALAKDNERRQVAPERTQATPAEIRAAVPEVRATWCTKMWSRAAAIGAGAMAIGQGVVGHISAAKDTLQPVQDLLGDVPPWAWAVLVGGVASYIWYVARQGEAAGAEAYQTGARR